MPWFLARLAWAFRRKRLVRLHLEVAEGKPDTIEGWRLGIWGGHYVLTRARIFDAQGRTHALDGDVEIPRSRVMFVQRLTAVEAS